MINLERIRRLSNLEELSLRLKKTKKWISALRVLSPLAKEPNQRWSMDFMFDALYDGLRFRVFTTVHKFSRVSRALKMDFLLTGKRIVRVLKGLKWTHGLPSVIHCDNGSEFISRAVDDWLTEME